MAIPLQLAFDSNEYERRRVTIQERLLAMDLDAIMLFVPHNVYYLCGMDSENLYDYQVLVLPATGSPLLVISEFERARSENSTYASVVETYGMLEDPLPVTIQALRACCSAPKEIGFDRSTVESLPDGWLDRLRSELPGTRFRDAFGVVEEARLAKSEAELGYIRQAGELTRIGVDSGIAAVAPGRADHEIAAEVIHAMYASGSQTVCWGPIVAAGYRSGAAHSSFNGYQIKEGDSVFFEVTGEMARYTSPLMRTVVVGRPSSEMERTAAAAKSAVTAIVKAARTGTTAHEVALRGLEALEPVLDGIVFHFHFGYPVGIGYPPSWIERLGFIIRTENRRELQRGMVFHLPMSLRKFGEWGINLSQTIIVNDDGADVIGTMPAELVIVK